MQARPSNSVYQLLNKRPSPARPQVHMSLHEFRNSSYVSAFGRGPFALDFEANTPKPHLKELYIRTMAIANDEYVVGVDFLDCNDDDWAWLVEWLPKQDIIVFNALYEQALIYRMSSKFIKPYADLYIILKNLGGKKKFNDRVTTHSLKSAQVNLLAWREKGNDEIKEYMKANTLTWSDVKLFDKDMLLKYNCLDADSTWSLYQLFRGLVKDHQDSWGQYFAEWHREDCLNAALLWVEAISYGLDINENQLTKHKQKCEEDRDTYLKSFMEHPKLKGGIEEFNKKIKQDLREAEPKKYRKDGKVTANWHKWEGKMEAAEQVNHFNTNSVQQLRWLLYEYAGIYPPKPTLSTDAESLNDIGEVGQLLLKYREMVTELKFVTQLTDNNTDGKFYPSVVYPGTDTGRVVSRESIK